LPRLDESGNADLEVIPGQPPNQLALPKGCPFADRCTYVTERCLEQNPALEEIATNHWAACWEAKNIIL
jgi:oligopeptide transport system ATP-binding protein